MHIRWSRHKKNGNKRLNLEIVRLIFSRSKAHWWMLALVFIAAISWLIFPIGERQSLINTNSFKIGEESNQDVFAAVSFDYEEIIDTEEEKKEILSEVLPVFDLSFEAIKKADDQINITRQVRNTKTLSDADRISKLKNLFYIGPSDEVGYILLKVSDAEIDNIQQKTKQVLEEVLLNGVTPDAEYGGLYEELAKIDYMKPKLDHIREKQNENTETTNAQAVSKVRINLIDNRAGTTVEKTVLVEELTPISKARLIIQDRAKGFLYPVSFVVEEMSIDLLRPNLIYNGALTKKRLDKRLNSDSFINQKISKGDKILGIGDIITESHIKKLKLMLSVQRRSMLLHTAPGILLITLTLLSLLFVYMWKYEFSLFSELRKLVAINLTIILLLGLGYVFIVYVPKDYSVYLIPTALASIVVAIIANVQLSIFITTIIGIFIAILSGTSLNGSLGYFLVIFAGGTAAAIAISNVRHRRHLIIPGLYVSGVNVIVIIAIGLINKITLVKLGMSCVVGSVNGIIVALLTPGLLPFFEYLSRTTTDMELLELADLNQPLLAQLKEKASGSYYHSIDVAKLAEMAAESIKANPLLARVGSYYHDIGKMSKPEYFIENQKGENLHDNLNPSMSSRIIASHVKDGAKIGLDNKLPQVILDIIQQHHGNTMIGGLRFYQKAMESDKHNTVRIEDFRYPGPRPHTKEAAIILLADSVESARHVLLHDNPSYSRLISFVREIVEDKTMDSQLDECDLTLRDVSLISDAFAKVLSGVYHTRIDYPKELETLSVGAQNGKIGHLSNKIGHLSNWLD